MQILSHVFMKFSQSPRQSFELDCLQRIASVWNNQFTLKVTQVIALSMIGISISDTSRFVDTIHSHSILRISDKATSNGLITD